MKGDKMYYLVEKKFCNLYCVCNIVNFMYICVVLKFNWKFVFLGDYNIVLIEEILK